MRKIAFIKVPSAPIQKQMFGSVAELATYVALCAHTNNKTRLCFPSQERLSRMTHISRRSVIRSIKTLQEKGLITIVNRRGRQAVYQINEFRNEPISDEKYPQNL